MVQTEWPVSDEMEEEQRAFWQKLNSLGARNIAKFPPEDVPDIDATVELPAAEWEDLKQEFVAINSSLGRTPAILGFQKQ